MKTILAIDDERDVLEIVRAVLKAKGYKIRCAEGGEDQRIDKPDDCRDAERQYEAEADGMQAKPARRLVIVACAGHF